MKNKYPNSIVALSAVLVDLAQVAPTEIRLTPAGSFRSARDNRPAGVPAWNMNSDLAASILSAKAGLKDKFLIDYDHQTIRAEANGQKAPAAGWAESLEWREGDGLYAVGIEWTEAALSAISGKEYRYISPVLAWDKKTGDVTDVLMASLVNYAALDGLDDLATLAADVFLNSQETLMDKDEIIERLMYLLNLPLTTTQEEMLAELDKLKMMIAKPDGTTDGLSAIIAGKDTEIAGLSGLVGSVDPAKYVPVDVVTQLQAEIAALSGQTVADKVEKLVNDGIASGKVFKGNHAEWATELGKKDIAALQGYLDKVPGIAALSGMQSQKMEIEDNMQTSALSATREEIAVAEQLGLTPEDIVKHRSK